MNDTITAYQALCKKHANATIRLTEASKKVLSKAVVSPSVIYAKIGANLRVSGQTVSNYVAGNCKDGFLTEAITIEFENYNEI